MKPRCLVPWIDRLPALTISLYIATALASPPPVFTQYIPGVNNNVTLLSQLDLYTVYSNIWGYNDQAGREYALVGVDAGLSIVDITDPTAPVEVDLIPGPTAIGTIWREIKTYQNYAYVVSEHTSPNNLSGLQVIDLSPLPDSASLVNVYLWPGVSGTNARAHTVSVDDQGYLYIQGGTATLGAGTNQGGIRILSLADPVNPTPVGVFAPRYVHDTFIKDDILFASNIFEGGHVDIVDVSNRASPSLIYSHTYPVGFSHNSGTTDDGNYLISTDELTGITVKSWDISVLWDSDTTNDDQIILVSEYIGDPEQIAHNVHIKGDYAYLSHYLEGVKILDIADPTELVEVAYYDTYLPPGAGFSGAWGVYPYFPSGNFCVSDIQSGLYVLRFDSVRAGGMEGIVTDAGNGGPLEDVSVFFLEANKSLLTNAQGFYELRTNEGNHTVIFSKTGYVPDTLVVDLPAGANLVQDVALEVNLAELEISVASISMTLPLDTVAMTELVISNAGVGGILTYTIDDIHGGAARMGRARSGDGVKKGVKLDFGSVGSTGVSTVPTLTPHVTAVQETVIVDPAGDPVFGSGPDILLVLAGVTGSDIAFDFEFVEPIDTDSAFVSISFDTDFDVETGAFPGGFGFNLPEQNIGAEYDVLLDISGRILGVPFTTYLFEGSNSPGAGELLYTTGLTVNADMVHITVPLSEIGNDEGNMAVAGFVGNIDDAGNATSIDYMPNVGNGTVGVNPFEDLPWLSLSQEAGSLTSGEADTIVVTFDTHGLDSGQVYNGVLLVLSSDADEPEVMIPVTLNTLPVGVEPPDELPSRFQLYPNYPNPFNPRTVIEFDLPVMARAELKVYDVLGKEIATPVDQVLPAGRHSISWTADGVASGVYIYRLRAGDFMEARKLVVVR